MQNRSMMNMNTWPDVKVYMASAGCLEDEEVFRGWLEHVPAMRREKALRPKNPEVRKLSLAAGALLTCSLADYVRGMRQMQGETDLPGDDLRPLGLDLSLEKSLVGNDDVAEFLVDLDNLQVHVLADELVVVTDLAVMWKRREIRKRISGGSDISQGALRNRSESWRWQILLIFTGSGR